MRVIQSFWTKPYGEVLNTKNPLFWAHRFFALCSFSLSAHLLAKQYGKTVLYTDAPGAQLLINQLKLPYASVNVVELQRLNAQNPNPEIWTQGKIWVYSLQTEKFLHVDLDAFLFKPVKAFPFMLAQSPDPIYTDSLVSLEYQRFVRAVLDFPMQPRFVKDRKELLAVKTAYNFGVFGVSQPCLFAQGTFELGEWLRRSTLNGLGKYSFAFEQFYLSLLAKQNSLTFDTLLPGSYVNAKVKHFTHFVAESKLNLEACRKLAAVLHEQFPDAFDLCLEHGY